MMLTRPQAHLVARGLGWFSLALGAVELLGGARVSRPVGLGERGTLVRAYGLREVVTGAGLLMSRGAPTPWLWARVAGDALDLATLAAGSRGRLRTGTGLALGAVVAMALLDIAAARRTGAPPPRPRVDYSDRSGWRQPVEQLRGAARDDFEAPRDLRLPPAMRPWTDAVPTGEASLSG